MYNRKSSRQAQHARQVPLRRWRNVEIGALAGQGQSYAVGVSRNKKGPDFLQDVEERSTVLVVQGRRLAPEASAPSETLLCCPEYPADNSTLRGNILAT